MTKKIDITSTALEKGFDFAKDFLDKLIMPSVEETGLLLKDKVTLWKFKNQVRMLNKASSYCDKNGISPKTISLKLLCPLLENASIEENETLHDKWAILLSNLVDSEQNIENHVFPYILGQISENEFLFLERVFFDKKEKVKALIIELETFKSNRQEIEGKLKEEVVILNGQIEEMKSQGFEPYSPKLWKLQSKLRDRKFKLNSLSIKEGSFIRKMEEPQIIPEDELRDFELSNLIRLGLVKYTQETYANSQSLEIPKENDYYDSSSVRVDFDIDIESENVHTLTELGELFLDACSEKRIKNNT